MATYVKVDVDLMNKLVTSFDKTQSNLTNDGYSLSGYLDQAWEDPSHAKPVNTSGTWAGGEVPSLRRRAALAVTAAAAEPGPLKPGMTVQIDEDQISKLTPAQAKTQADQAAALLKKAKPDSPADMPTPEQVKDMQQAAALLAANKNDPYFAAELAKQMPPAQIAAIPQWMEWQRENMQKLGSQVSDLGYPTDSDGLIAAQKTIMTSMGPLMALATSNTGPLALPSDYAQQWLKVTTDPDFKGAGMMLGYLMQSGRWGTQFLTDYTNGIYKFETSDDCPPGFWKSQSEGTNIYAASGTIPMPTGLTAPYDNMAAALSALGENPTAAQAVLHDKDMLHYLSQTRYWTDDNGAGYGKAIDAATEVFRNSGTTGKTSAEIASWVVDSFGDKSGRLSDDDDTGNSMKNMRGSMARLFASYIGDVDRVAAQNGDDTSVPAATNLTDTGMPNGGLWGATFNLDQLKSVLGATETDDDAFKRVSAAGLAYETSRLNYALSHGESGDSATYQNAVEHDAAVMGLLMSTGGVANVAAGQEKDERTAEWLSLAKGAAGMIPLPESKLLELAVDQGEDKLADSLQTDYAGAAADQADSTSTAMENTLALQTVTALYRNGAVAVGGPNDPVTSYPGGKDFASYTLGPDGKPRIVLSDPKDLSPTALQEMHNWLHSAGSPYTRIEPTLLAVYNNEFKKYWG